MYSTSSDEADLAHETDALPEANSREKKVILWKYRAWKEKHDDDDLKTRQRQMRNNVRFILEEAKRGIGRRHWAKDSEWWIAASKEVKGKMEEKDQREREEKLAARKTAEDKTFRLAVSRRFFLLTDRIL